jgi:hypothetical protein
VFSKVFKDVFDKVDRFNGGIGETDKDKTFDVGGNGEEAPRCCL